MIYLFQLQQLKPPVQQQAVSLKNEQIAETRIFFTQFAKYTVKLRHLENICLI